jgi:hypothetical protein
LRTKSEFTEDRDIDLLHVFNDVVRNYNVKSQCEALRIALDKPSKRFYVTPECVCKAISRIRRGDELQEMKPSSRLMYFELYRLYCEVKSRRPALPNNQVCELIVELPASRFFVSMGTAVKIINRQRKIEQCKKLNLLSQYRHLR